MMAKKRGFEGADKSSSISATKVRKTKQIKFLSFSSSDKKYPDIELPNWMKYFEEDYEDEEN